MSATVVFATPTSSWSDAAAAASRSRVACWASARALSSYLRFWVDMAFIEAYSPAISCTPRSLKGHTRDADNRRPEDRRLARRQVRQPRLDRRPLHDRHRGDARRRLLPRRAPDAAAGPRRAAAPPHPRGRVLVRARGADGRAARRRRRLRRGGRPRPQAAQPVAHVLERGRRAVPDPRYHRPRRVRAFLRRARRRRRRRSGRPGVARRRRRALRALLRLRVDPGALRAVRPALRRLGTTPRRPPARTSRG